MKVSDYIVKELEKYRVTSVFGYQGGNITHLIDSIGNSEEIEFVENYNEQASSFAANAYASIHDSLGVAISSSGPGAINMVNGVANAYYDSIPCLFITGDVNVATMKKDNSIRQNAFQETDIISIVKSITKYAITVTDANDIPYELSKAIHMALEDRKGPVLLNIPHDIQRADIDNLEKYKNDSILYLDKSDVEQLESLLTLSKRPLLIVGGGARSYLAKRQLLEFLKCIKIPVVASLQGIDVIPHNNPSFCGLIGSYGNRYANLAVKYSDLLIVLGSRLDDRQIPSRDHDIIKNKLIVHVDIEKAELNHKVNEILSIHASVENFLMDILQYGLKTYDYTRWIEIIKRWEKRFPSWNDKNQEVNVNDFIHMLNINLTSDAIICADVGQNQMCVAQAIKLSNNRRLLNSSGLGSMGYSIPAGIGASYGGKGEVICIVGDGGIQMNIQELQTINRENLPIHIIIMNNQCLGMIRDLQEKVFDSRFYGTVEGFGSPSYEMIAKAYEFAYYCVDTTENYTKAFDFMKSCRRAIVEVLLPQKMTANPDLGKGIFDQFPELQREEIEKIEGELKDENI